MERHGIDENRAFDLLRERSRVANRRIVEDYLPLAHFAALRYANGPEPLDDLVQVAAVGLLKALDRFDPDDGAAFSSFAMPTMHGELRRHFRDRSWAVRPPRRLQEDALRVARVTTELLARQRHHPSVEDVARRARLTVPAVLAAREALAARERQILRLRFVEDLTQGEIASIVGISQMHVSRLLRKGTVKLRVAATVAA